MVWLSLVSFLVLIVLVWFNYQTNRNILFLGLYFLGFNVHNIAVYYALIENDLFWLTVFFNHFTPLYLLIGPFFYFYIRGLLNDRFEFKRKDLLHFIPALVQLVAIVPYLFLTSFEDKQQLIMGFVSQPKTVLSHKFNLLFDFRESHWIRTLSMLFYFILFTNEFRKFLLCTRAKIKTLMQELFNFRWSLFLSISFLLVLALNLYYVFQLSVNPMFLSGSTIGLIGLIVFGIVLFNNLSLLFFPQVLYGIPQKGQIDSRDNSDSNANQSTLSAETSSNTGLSEKPLFKSNNYFFDLEKRIKDYFSSDRPYLDKDFQLQTLSNHLGVPQHHISYCLRYYFNTTFSDFKNRYRLNYFKGLVKEGQIGAKTIEAMIDESGFRSRSAFYASFEKIEEISLSEYLKSTQ